MSVDRAELYRRCDLRVDAMIAAGAIAEARSIAGLDLDPKLPAMRAVGLRPFIENALGRMSLEDAAQKAKQETRNYAKRQLTWLKGNFNSENWRYLEQTGRTKQDLKIIIRKRLTSKV